MRAKPAPPWVLLFSLALVFCLCVQAQYTNVPLEGGAIFIEGSSSAVVNFNNVVFDGCEADTGGAIYTESNLDIFSTVFVDNSALTGNGSALFYINPVGPVTLQKTTSALSSVSLFHNPGIVVQVTGLHPVVSTCLTYQAASNDVTFFVTNFGSLTISDIPIPDLFSIEVVDNFQPVVGLADTPSSYPVLLQDLLFDRTATAKFLFVNSQVYFDNVGVTRKHQITISTASQVFLKNTFFENPTTSLVLDASTAILKQTNVGAACPSYPYSSAGQSNPSCTSASVLSNISYARIWPSVCFGDSASLTLKNGAALTLDNCAIGFTSSVAVQGTSSSLSVTGNTAICHSTVTTQSGTQITFSPGSLMHNSTMTVSGVMNSILSSFDTSSITLSGTSSATISSSNFTTDTITFNGLPVTISSSTFTSSSITENNAAAIVTYSGTTFTSTITVIVSGYASLTNSLVQLASGSPSWTINTGGVVSCVSSTFLSNTRGAIALTASKADQLTIDNCTFDSNSNTQNGGALAISYSSFCADPVKYISGSFVNNIASPSVNGGAVYSEVPLNWTGPNFKNNQAPSGGGGDVYVTASKCSPAFGTFVQFTSLTSQSSSAYNGGSLYFDLRNKTGTISQSNWLSGNASQSGGHIYIVATAGQGNTFTLLNSALSSSVATVQNGGSLYIQDIDNVVLHGDTWATSTAGNDGGAVYASNVLTFDLSSSSSITTGKASQDGGGVYLSTTRATSGLKIIGNTFTGCSATRNGGPDRKSVV